MTNHIVPIGVETVLEVEPITIAGSYTIDGYLSEDHIPTLDVVIINGAAYEIDEIRGRLGGRIEIDADGALCAWGAGVAFLPDDPTEIDRIGREYFRRK